MIEREEALEALEDVPIDAPEETAQPGDGFIFDPADNPNLNEQAGEEPAGRPVQAPPVPGAPNVSPDGSWIAYLQANDSGELTLWLSPLDGGAPHAVPVAIELLPMSNGPQWSPDGTSLALVGKHPSDDRSSIWIVNVAGGAARLLVDHQASDHSPVWSPDGTAIAFIAGRDGRDSLSAISADGFGSALQLSYAAPGLDDHSPVWSTDGKRIAFARRATDGEQTGDHIWTITLETGELKQVTKRLNPRRELRWAPDRALIMHIAEDGDWDNVSVVNPDNSAGWNIASEFGDKSDPHWTHDGQRVVYIRRKDGVARCCERGTSSSSSETLDPGAGIVHHVRFLPDKRVLYCYAPATGAARFYIQEAKADAERTELPAAVAWSTDRALIQPVHAEYEINGRKIGGMTYRLGEQAGPAPAVILLMDQPDQPQTADFSVTAQALAAAGLTVFAPSLPGSGGYGKKISNGLKDAAGSEAEANDLAGIVAALQSVEGIDKHRIAVAGEGHGGARALLLAGARVGSVQAVAVVDPITDWNIEFDHADERRRAWLVKNFGLPATNFAVYAIRTPSTFIGLIEAPVLLIGTDPAPSGRAEQLDILAADLADLGVPFERESASGESEWSIGQRIAAFLRESLLAVTPPADPRMEQALTADAI